MKSKLHHHVLFFILLGTQVIAQTLPTSENQRSKNGNRNGKWVVWFNKESKPTISKDSTIYYREISYLEGKPDGVVKDYYLNGKIKWEGLLVTDQPVDVRSGKSIFYNEEGDKIEEAQYNRIGKKISSKEFRKPIQGTDTLDLLFRKGNVEFMQGNFSKALEYWEKGKTLAEQKFEVNHLSYASFLVQFALFYEAIGNFEKAESYLIKAYQIVKPISDIVKAGRNFLLGQLYRRMGLYDKAEPLLLEAVKIFRSNNQINSQNYLITIEVLGLVYCDLGNYDKATPLLLEATQSIYGSTLPGYTNFLENLGNLYAEENKDYEAQKLYLKSLRVSTQLYGNTSPQLAESLTSLAFFYRKAGKYSKADSSYKKAVQIIKDKFGEGDIRFATAINNWALLLSDRGEFGKAEELYRESINIKRNKLGESNISYKTTIGNLANLYLRAKSYTKAEENFLLSNKNLLDEIIRFFPNLSEKEKEDFYKTVKERFELFNAFALLRYQSNPSITDEMFNLQLSTKALLLNSSAKWKQRIRGSGDKKLAALYYKWEDKQAILAKLYKDTTKQKSIDSLQSETNALEKELSQRSESFANFSEQKRYTWQDVQQKLKPEEAAIEIIRLRKFGTSKIITDSSDVRLTRYKKLGLTDTVYYAALIITAASKHPELITIKNGNELEKQKINYYRNSINTQSKDELSYTQFWEPISKALGKKIKKIYFSPDGIYNSINLNTLLNPKTKKYILEEIDLQLLTTSKDLLVAKKEESFNTLAYLIGYPNYQTSKEKRATLVEKERSAQPNYYSSNLSRGDNLLEELPATKTEVEDIATLLSAKGWKPEVLTGDDALEETLKDAFKPQILHIATHGYFQTDSSLSARTNPLLQSGLMLTGAGRTLTGDKDDTTEDGILTAYEAMNLNLDNTELVVLSACETGLGEIRNGEGVYGLQRAFKVAGAKSIIMSLWKVNDEATQQLITEFYKFWLESGNKRTAFKKAQLNILAKYPNPYYWGAFVMVGE